MRTEQQALRVSLVAVLLLSALGIGFGLVSGSSAIIFDGFFSLIDAVMSLITIVVAGLIVRSTQAGDLSDQLNRRFNMGIWHFEPMVLAVSALLMMSFAGYAFFQALNVILEGGSTVDFGPAAVYAAVVLALTTSIAVLQHRANRRIGSAFVAMDVKSWIMAGGITSSLLVAFLIGIGIDGTRAEWMMPYIDPVVLMLVALVLIPLPFSNLRKAVSEIALVTPQELREEVEIVASRTVEAEEFLDYRAYVAQVGRSRQVEINFIAPRELPPRQLEAWDAIRENVRNHLGPDDPDTTVTVTFTANAQLA